MKKIINISLMFILGTLFIVGCGNSSKNHTNSKEEKADSTEINITSEDNSNTTLTDDIITSVIKKYLKVRYHIENTKGTNVEKVEIKKKGNYNTENKYWPVKAFVTVNYMKNSQLYRLEEIENFKIYQDDFKEWKAEELPTTQE